MRSADRVVCLLLLSAVCAEAQPDVAAILKKVSELYKGAAQYEMMAEIIGPKSDPQTADKPGRAIFAFKPPNRYRIEGAPPGIWSVAPELSGGVVIVHDGSAVWFYFLKANQYFSVPAAALMPDARGGWGGLRPEAVDDFTMSPYRGADAVEEAKYLRDETIDYAGAKVDCYVVSVSLRKGGPIYTWWVDKKSSRILREDHPGVSMVFTSIKLNESLPDDLFKFVPPAGAQEIKIPPPQ